MSLSAEMYLHILTIYDKLVLPTANSKHTLLADEHFVYYTDGNATSFRFQFK